MSETEKMKELRKTGTTTVGITFKDGVVLGTERKSTMGYLVASKESKKLFQLDEHIGMTIAGIAGDAQALARLMTAELKLYKFQENKKISVKAAATLLANILYSRRMFPYIVQLIVGGFDENPHIYSFDPAGAIEEEREFFSTGSGSPIALGVLEDKYKPNMPIEDAKKLVARAIRAATERDIASGGRGVELAVIDSKGFRMVPKEESDTLIR